MKTTLLFEQISKGQQDVIAERVLRLTEGDKSVKIRVKIKSDSYDFQCYAKSEAYNPQTLSWNPIASIGFSNMKTKKSLAFTPHPVGFSAFEADINTLVAQTVAIVMD